MRWLGFAGLLLGLPGAAVAAPVYNPIFIVGPAGQIYAGPFMSSSTAYATINQPSNFSGVPFGVAINGTTKFYVDNYGNAVATNMAIGATGASSSGCGYAPSSAMLGYNCFSSDHDVALVIYPPSGTAPFDFDEAGTLVAQISATGVATFTGLINNGTTRSPVKPFTAAFTFGTGAAANIDTAEVTNTSATAYAATLPTCNAAVNGLGYGIAKIDANTNPITLTTTGTDTISGNPAAATVSIATDGTSVTVKCDGNGLWLRGLH